MHIDDRALDEVREQGFTVVEGFLGAGELAEAQAALARVYPTPEEYFADPEKHAALVAHQFAGLERFPYEPWEINRLAFHPDLVEAAERFCGTTDIDLYKVELWAKYSGAVDYDQALHRDYMNHNMVVPRADLRWPQMTTFILLSDVTDQDGPTKVLPRAAGDDVPLSVARLGPDEYREREVSVTGPAGTLFIYTTDIFHRGSAMTGTHRHRFALLADFKARGAPWLGRRAWPDSAMDPAWQEILGRASPRERELFGFPAVGDPYWNDQTRRDVAVRWPGIDMTPYEA